VKRVGALAALVGLNLGALSASASASVTIGSNLAAEAGEGLCGFGGYVISNFPCSGWQTSLPPDQTASGGLTSPINGVIVRWRVKFAAPAGDLTNVQVQPHLFPGRPSESPQPFVTLPLGSPGILTVNSRIPITVGESLGVNTLLDGGPLGGAPPIIGSGSGTMNDFNGVAKPGEVPSEAEPAPGELLVNADIEPDADHDGYGDETQDLCPTDPTIQVACPDRVSPTARISYASVQDIVKQRTVKVRLTSSENGTGFAEGTLKAPSGNRVFKLISTEAPVLTDRPVTLRLRLTKRALKATKQALRMHRKVKATVTAFAKDAAGNVSGVTEVTVRGKPLH
jgi:hypothetical protein